MMADDPSMNAWEVTMPGVPQSSTGRLGISIPGPFLAAGTRGTLLRLVPVEIPASQESTELYFKSGPEFTLGRSPEADWVTCFFPRHEKNDQRSRRLSKLHARIEFRDDRLWIHRLGNGPLHVNDREIGPAPVPSSLADRDQIVLAEDYSLKIHYEVSLQNTFQFTNGGEWQSGRIELNPELPGAIRFEPTNSVVGFRNSCWLFADVGFGNSRGGAFPADSELAPQQGTLLRTGQCFWILNWVNNAKVAVNEYKLIAQEVVPLSHGDQVRLGASCYRAEIS